jgi:hypothetical protein
VRTGLLQEAANTHAVAAAAREAKLQAEFAAAHEIQRVKEAMARQACKDADDLKQRLEDAEWKAKGRDLRPSGHCRGYVVEVLVTTLRP